MFDLHNLLEIPLSKWILKNIDQYIEISENAGIFYSIIDILKVARNRLEDYK